MLNILKKELKDSFRDRRTLLLTVLLPLVLMSALVFFYENLLASDEDETYGIVVNEEQLEFAKQLLTSYDNMEVTGVANVEETIANGDAIAGVIIPSDFEQQITTENTPTIQVLGDLYSQKSALAASYIESAFGQYNQQIVAERLQQNKLDSELLTPFTIEQVQTVEGDSSMMLIAFLVPLMLSVAVGIGVGPSASDLVAGEKERRTMEALLMTPVNRSDLLLGKWITMVIIASLTGIITLLIVTVEIIFFTEKLKEGLAFENNEAIWIAVVALLVIIAFAALMASALMVTSILAKTVKESQSYGTPVTMIVMLPALLTSSLGLNELSTIHFVVPLMNLFTIFKELFFGVLNVEHILLTLSSNILLAIIIFFIGRVLFMKDRWILSN